MLLVLQFDAFVRLQWMEDRPKKMCTTVILSPASYFVSVGCSHEADGLRRFQAPIFEVYIYSNPILIYIYIITPYLGPKNEEVQCGWYLMVFNTRGTGCDWIWLDESCLPQVVQDFSDHCDLSRPLRKQFLGSMSDIGWIWKKCYTVTHLKAWFGTAWTCLDFWYVWKGRGDCCHL